MVDFVTYEHVVTLKQNKHDISFDSAYHNGFSDI